MHRRYLLILLVAFVVSLSLPACDRDDGTQGEIAATGKSEPVPSANAELPAGPIEDTGQFVLPNGRLVWPAGVGTIVDLFANDLAVSPDGSLLVVVSAGVDRVRLIDTATMTSLQEFDTGPVFGGAVWNSAGDRFWVGGGGSQQVIEFEVTAGVANELRRIDVHNYPSGLELSPNENRLYVSCMTGRRMAVVNLLTGREIKSYDAHLYSYDVKVTGNGRRAFVSNTGRASVTAINLQNDTVLGDIDVGQNPEGMAISPDNATLYVANADADTISVVDVDTLAVVDTWELHPDDTLAIGASPVAIQATAGRVYVACSGTNEIVVLDPDDGTVLGRIPTGWYATNLRLDEANDMLYYTSGKGYGSYQLGLHGNWRSTVHAVEIPDAGALADWTEQQDFCLNWSLNFYDLQDVESPIPLEYGTPSEQIKHVVFILKENKTFDQVFGDFEGARRNPDLLNFGEDITPNHHELGRQFVLCDNLYVEGDTSVLGHLWGTFGILNDITEKSFITHDRYPLPDIDPTARMANGTIFERLLEEGIEFRSYGQIIGFMSDLYRYAPYIDLKYGFWNMGVLDVDKADEIIREWELGIFPPFIYISLPNDHTYGSSSGAPTARYLMGDNDAGLGKLVEWLSNSEYWEETVVFVTEDDPQSGADHIDPHRTIGLVIGPYVKRDHISRTLYSMSSIWHTIELILGIPPSSKYSQYAAPMYDCFATEPDLSTYTAIPNPIPYEENEDGLPFQEYCDNADFNAPDQVSRMGEVLWALTRPGEPFPYENSLSGYEEEDEAEEAKEYREWVEHARQYAIAHGIEINW